MLDVWRGLEDLVRRSDFWLALGVAVGLWLLRRRWRVPEHLRPPVQRGLRVGTFLALAYVVLVTVETLLGLSLVSVRDVWQRGGVIAVLAYVAWELLDIGLREAFARVKPPDVRAQRRLDTALTVIRWLGRMVILFVVVATLLDLLRINIAPLVASVGVVGLALGLGAQKLVQDVISGLFIILEDQFNVGDSVEVAGVAGGVEEMTLRVTKIRDFHGVLHIIPNSEIRKVANRTRDWARAIVEVGVAYDSDLGYVMEVLAQVGEALYAENPDGIFLEKPTPSGPETFGDSAITVRLLARVQPGKQWDAQRLMRRRIKEAFDRAGITIPFPQVDVHIKEGAPSATPPRA